LIGRTLLQTLLMLVTGVLAQSPTSQPAEKPDGTKATNDPVRGNVKIVAGMPSSGDALVDETLDKLEARGKTAKAIEAEIQYDYITPGPIEGLEDTQTKMGTLFFVQTGHPRFLVHFTKKVQGGTVDSSAEYYAFDGLWLTERNDRSKSVIRREIVKPGQHVDLFDLGRGPFPLPFGRSRAEMLYHFEIKLHSYHGGASKDEPIQLRCLPREGTDLGTRYRYVDLFIDRKLDLPTQVVCQRKIDENRISVKFAKIREHETIDANRFVVPTPAGFQESFEPLQPPPESAASASPQEN
jgi:hypothetical protein